MIGSSFIAAALLVLAPAAAQPEVKLGLGTQPTFSADGEIAVPVVIGPLGGESVAALQFDLLFATAQLQFSEVEAGPSASDASKSAHANSLKPGTARIIVAGLNRNAMADGVVVIAHFSPAPGAQPPYTLSIGGVVLSDPFGTAVGVTTSPNTLTLDPGAAIALASDTAQVQSTSAIEMLVRYRALLFAALLVGGAMFFARRAPRKGRVR